MTRLEGRGRHWVLTLLLGAMAAGCDSEPITGVHITVHFDGMQVDQLEFDVKPQGGDAVVARRPAVVVPGAWLASPQDVLVYLPDLMADQTVACKVTGLAMDKAMAPKVETEATLRLHEMVPASVRIEGK